MLFVSVIVEFWTNMGSSILFLFLFLFFSSLHADMGALCRNDFLSGYPPGCSISDGCSDVPEYLCGKLMNS